MALTIRDVRQLRDALFADDDWDKAARAYAAEHDRYYGVIHNCEDWLTEFFYGISAEARKRREEGDASDHREIQSRVPDHIFSGPELPLDESVKHASITRLRESPCAGRIRMACLDDPRRH